MKVGLKLFNKANELVHEREDAPKEVGDAAMVQYEGKFYSYRSIHTRSDREILLNGPYARFDECNAPLILL
jgi:hypothetical protein